MSSVEGTGYRTDGAATDDTARVPAQGTGERSTAAERLGGPRGSEPAREQATLIPADRAEGYRMRWNEIKGEFVDEPRTAVRSANALVGEVLDELEALFRKQRDDVEHGLDREATSTEDLRLALGNYRSFFDRLLSF